MKSKTTIITAFPHGYSAGDEVTIPVEFGNTKVKGTWVVGEVTTDSFTIRDPTRWERIKSWARRWWRKVRRWLR